MSQTEPINVLMSLAGRTSCL